MLYITRRGERIRTTIDVRLQDRATEIVNNHQRELAGNFIFNAAALILKPNQARF